MLLPIADLERPFNLFEAALWFGIACTFAVKAWRRRNAVRRSFTILAVAFLLFGVSDVIESRTGAWWDPLWLLILKGSCVLAFVHGFALYYRERSKRRKAAQSAPPSVPL